MLPCTAAAFAMPAAEVAWGICTTGIVPGIGGRCAATGAARTPVPGYGAVPAPGWGPWLGTGFGPAKGPGACSWLLRLRADRLGSGAPHEVQKAAPVRMVCWQRGQRSALGVTAVWVLALGVLQWTVRWCRPVA